MVLRKYELSKQILEENHCHKENELMSDLIWITDSCHNMELIKKKLPHQSNMFIMTLRLYIII